MSSNKIETFFRKNFTTKKLIFFSIFMVLSFFAQRVNFSALVGAENQFFTLFQFFAPVAGIFLGPVFGISAVLLAEIANFALQAMPFTALNMLRLIPILFATYYFGSRKEQRLSIVIPALAIVAFVLQPVGRTAWFFTLFWTIPIIIRLLPQKYREKAFLRSLGATFSAHAVGGAIWAWTVPMTQAQWIGLIPVVVYERLLFASGITVTYVALNTLLAWLDTRLTQDAVAIDKNYVIGKKPSV